MTTCQIENQVLRQNAILFNRNLIFGSVFAILAACTVLASYFLLAWCIFKIDSSVLPNFLLTLLLPGLPPVASSALAFASIHFLREAAKCHDATIGILNCRYADDRFVKLAKSIGNAAAHDVTNYQQAPPPDCTPTRSGRPAIRN